MSSIFSPPPNPSDGASYTFGNLIWNYEADNGVWNIASGTIIGGQGPPGPAGSNGTNGTNGETGATGTTGATGAFSGLLYTFRHPSVSTFSYSSPPPSGEIGFVSAAVGANTLFIPDLDVNGATHGVSIGRWDDSTDTASRGTIYIRRAFSLTGEAILTQNSQSIATVMDGSMGYRGFTGTNDSALADMPPNGSLVSINHWRTGNRGSAGSNGSQGVAGPTGAGVTGFSVGSDGILRGVFINRGASEPFIAGQTGDITLGYIKGTTGPVGGTTQQVLFVDAAFPYGASGNGNLLFDGKTLTFGANSGDFGIPTRMTITGDILLLGYTMEVNGGIFTTPAERSPYQDVGSVSTLAINATGGSIQRYKVTPQPGFKITTGSGWHPDPTVTETIAVIIQTTNGTTGEFAPSILTERGSRKPILFGVTGGIDILSIMRIKTSSGGLTMGFQVANGMTAANFSID